MSRAAIKEIYARQVREIRRRVEVLRNGQPLPDLKEKTVILVDDGIAMGSTMRASVECCRHYGAVFLGSSSAEVAGDYGAGPNHTLPTGGGARFTGGLSVMHFLRLRTWLRLEPTHDARAVYEDAAHLAELEGLDAHRRAALLRAADGS